MTTATTKAKFTMSSSFQITRGVQLPAEDFTRVVTVTAVNEDEAFGTILVCKKILVVVTCDVIDGAISDDAEWFVD